MITLISHRYPAASQGNETANANVSQGQISKDFDCSVIHLPLHARGRGKTGEHRAIQDYVLSSVRAKDIIQRAIAEAKDGTTMTFGCMDGKKRSVAVVERLALRLRNSGHEVAIRHTELEALG